MSKKNVTISSIIVYKAYSLLGHACRILFSLFSAKKLRPEKEVSDINLLFFSGQKGAKMLKAVILSVHQTWEKVPHITIITDGTPVAIIEKQLAFWPYPYTLKTWEDAAAFHQDKGRHSLIEWSRINVFAKKLLSILAEAEARPTLYCDTDILWFAEPRLPEPQLTESGSPASHSPETTTGFTMRMSRDNTHCYHMPLIRYLNRHDMLEKPAWNAGLIYLSGSPYDHYKDFGQLMDFVKIFNEGHSEQLTFALMADRLGDSWTLDEVIINTRDLHWPLIPRYYFSGSQFARHHVLTKNSWFWRDALYILLFKGKTRRQPAAR
jgi:hypothetical protein